MPMVTPRVVRVERSFCRRREARPARRRSRVRTGGSGCQGGAALRTGRLVFIVVGFHLLPLADALRVGPFGEVERPGDTAQGADEPGSRTQVIRPRRTRFHVEAKSPKPHV